VESLDIEVRWSFI